MDTSFLDQILDKVSNLEGWAAYGTMFSVLVTCGLGLPIPEDLTLVTAGYLAYLENVDLLPAIGICFIGVLTGDFILFMLGRKLGTGFFNLPGVRFIVTPERVAIAQEKLKKNARKVCFVARFLAGLRAPIYLSAGMLGVKPATFVSLDALAALISVPTIVYLGFYFGDEIELGLHYIRKAEKYLMITLAVVGLIVIISALRKHLRGNVEEA
jgi:membrane protein DedA with SNARE-associated domain